MYQFARIPTTRSNMLFWEGILRQAQENRISFSLKLNGIWLWWQFFRFWAQSYSMWCKIERKTVTTIIFHSISKEKEIYFPECSYQVPFFPAFVEGQDGISTTIRRTTIREACASQHHEGLIKGSPETSQTSRHNATYRGLKRGTQYRTLLIPM